MKGTKFVFLLSFLQILTEICGERSCKLQEFKKKEIEKVFKRCLENMKQCKIGMPMTTKADSTGTTAKTKSTLIPTQEKSTSTTKSESDGGPTESPIEEATAGISTVKGNLSNSNHAESTGNLNEEKNTSE